MQSMYPSYSCHIQPPFDKKKQQIRFEIYTLFEFPGVGRRPPGKNPHTPPIHRGYIIDSVEIRFAADKDTRGALHRRLHHLETRKIQTTTTCWTYSSMCSDNFPPCRRRPPIPYRCPYEIGSLVVSTNVFLETFYIIKVDRAPQTTTINTHEPIRHAVLCSSATLSLVVSIPFTFESFPNITLDVICNEDKNHAVFLPTLTAACSAKESNKEIHVPFEIIIAFLSWLGESETVESTAFQRNL